MSPEIAALIARKKAERVAKGFGMRIIHENAPDFTGYYADKATFDEQYAIAVSLIGKKHRSGVIIKSVEQIAA